jgi:ParB-like chromosome segregation protein Spo0J
MTSTRNAAPLVRRSVERADTLRPAAYNPRKISKEALKGLQASIERWGVVQDIVVNSRNRVVVGGHQRLAALKAAGVHDIPVTWVDLEETDEKALNVALNNPHIAGEFDDTLQTLLAEIQEGIGLDAFEQVGLDDLLKKVVESDTSSQLGDLEYRVVIENLTEEAQADLIEDLESRGFKCKAMMS